MPLNSAAMLSPTESPTKSIEPTGAASIVAPAIGLVSNHGAGRSKVDLNVQPETFTVAAVPTMSTEVA